MTDNEKKVLRVLRLPDIKPELPIRGNQGVANYAGLSPGDAERALEELTLLGHVVVIHRKRQTFYRAANGKATIDELMDEA